MTTPKTAAELLNAMRDCGFTIHLNGDSLKISRARWIDSELAELITTHKKHLIELLEIEVEINPVGVAIISENPISQHHPLKKQKGNIMTDIKTFKHITSTNLPESLYQQLEPHLDSLLNVISYDGQLNEQYSYLREKDNHKRLKQLDAEFMESVFPMWLVFTRERWSDVDNYFNLEESKVIHDSLPF